MIVVIAEKPSVAKDIAKVIGANQSKQGYIEGNGYQVTWAIGHLLALSNPDAYDPALKSWDLKHLPILPQSFKLTVTKTGSKQFKVIKSLLQNASSVINAGDAGREGELIQRWILQYARYKGNVQRLWISSLTNASIQQGFNSLIPQSSKDNLFKAGEARSHADWLVGLNATRALTASNPGTGKQPLSLGRVQTPVLAMICQRTRDNRSFIPQDYFLPQLLVESESSAFKITHESKEKILEQSQAQTIVDQAPNPITCTNVELKEKKDNQPLLYDLTTLQADANRKHGFSAQKTLTLTQELYEKFKVVTYPRTDSRYITSDIYDTLPTLFEQVKQYPELATHVNDLPNPLPKRSVNNNKVSDHHAIILTGEYNASLPDDNQKIFDLIAKRFIAAFSELCLKSITTYSFETGQSLFKTTGTTILKAGWRSVEAPIKDEDEQPDDNTKQLPRVTEGQQLPILKKLVTPKKTTAPPLYSEASLLKAMEGAGKLIEDEELAQAIKGQGIGTPATRASIIETLIKRTYITRSKNKVVPTDLGYSVYDLVKDFPISSPSLTGDWEYKLHKMEEGNYSYNDFRAEIDTYTTELVENLKNSTAKIEIDSVPCPKCSKGNIIERSKGYSCTAYPTCDYVIWKKQGKQNISWSKAKQMITSGHMPTKSDPAEFYVGEYKGEKIYHRIGTFGPYYSFKGKSIKSTYTEKPTLQQSLIDIQNQILLSKERKRDLEKSTLAVFGQYMIRQGEKAPYVTNNKDSAPLPSWDYKEIGLEAYIAGLDASKCQKIISDFKKWKRKK